MFIVELSNELRSKVWVGLERRCWVLSEVRMFQIVEDLQKGHFRRPAYTKAARYEPIVDLHYNISLIFPLWGVLTLACFCSLVAL